MQQIRSQAQFDRLVSDLEIMQANDPNGYQRRVIALALLGQVYLWSMAILAIVALAVSIYLAVVSFLIWVKVLIFVAPIVFIVISALFVSFDPPTDEGLEVEEEDAPELFDVIEELRDAINAPVFHHVIITDELNAAVVQMPKFGFLGGTTNYLIIGLPLMQALTTAQLKSVLAHEFGHLSKSHARLFNWIYRQRMRLVKILDKIDDRRSGGDFIIRPFLNWYIPYFNAYSFPLARANEYEADEIAANITSPQEMAQALVNVEVFASYRHEKFWHSIFKDTKKSPKPMNTHPSKVFASQVNNNENQYITIDDSKKWLDIALERKTTTADTHPCLTDRLSALQTTNVHFKVTHEPKSTILLGESLTEIVQEFDNEWRGSVYEYWQNQHKQSLEDTEKFTTLQQRHKSGETLTVDEQLERVQLAHILDLINDEVFIKHLQSLQTEHQNHAGICFFLGAQLLKNHNEAGVHLLQKAMSSDPNSKKSACRVLCDYFGELGNVERSNFWYKQLEEIMQDDNIRYVAENRIDFDDTYMSNNLPNDVIDKLKWGLKTIPDIKQAILVTRVGTAHSREINVLAFKAIGHIEGYSQRKVDEVHDRIEILIADKIKADILVLCFDGSDDDSFYKKLKQASGDRLI